MRVFVWTCSALFAIVFHASAAEWTFDEVVIDPQAAQKAVYAVTPADVNGDGRPDIVAVNETEVNWYENPSWKKRTIIAGQTEPDNVCIAPHDIDGDGKIDFALGAGWTKVGTIQWLTRGESLDEPWDVHYIATEGWTHRMRWADVLGTGREQLVVSPLNATMGEGVRLLAFEVPADPTSERWQPTVLDDSLNRLHNHWHVELSDTEPAATLTASQEGVSLIRRTDDGFTRAVLSSGAEGDDPAQRGAGEVKSGLHADGSRFLATIEPMHGNQAVYYRIRGQLGDSQSLQRVVLDDTLAQGHAVWCADLNGDDQDEIIIGHRERGTGAITGPGVYCFVRTDPDADSWKKHVIDDGGMACEDLFCLDLDGDNTPEIIAGGRATKNVKLYRVVDTGE